MVAATALTDYPTLNAHVHTGPLRALTDLVGVRSTADGLRIVPRLPDETFAVRWPRFTVQGTATSIEGSLVTASTAPVQLEVLVPSGLRAGPVRATVDDLEVPSVVDDADLVRFSVPANPGGRIAWRVGATP